MGLIDRLIREGRNAKYINEFLEMEEEEYHRELDSVLRELLSELKKKNYTTSELELVGIALKFIGYPEALVTYDTVLRMLALIRVLTMYKAGVRPMK